MYCLEQYIYAVYTGYILPGAVYTQYILGIYCLEQYIRSIYWMYIAWSSIYALYTGYILPRAVYAVCACPPLVMQPEALSEKTNRPIFGGNYAIFPWTLELSGVWPAKFCTGSGTLSPSLPVLQPSLRLSLTKSMNHTSVVLWFTFVWIWVMVCNSDLTEHQIWLDMWPPAYQACGPKCPNAGYKGTKL